MPFANQHAARQKDPAKYDTFRRHQPEGWPEGVDAILGIKDGKSEIQSVRADKDKWTVDEFRAWLEEHDFKGEKIEPAVDEDESEPTEDEKREDDESAEEDDDDDAEEPDESKPGYTVESYSFAICLQDCGKCEGDNHVPDKFRMFANGWTDTSKGKLLFDDEAAESVMGAYGEGSTDKLPIDYGHGMLMAPQTRETGKAAGWFTPAVVDGELWATGVEWTKKGKRSLAAREYRYISPAVELDDERRVRRLINVALTNLPATRGLTPLVASATTTEITMGKHDECGRAPAAKLPDESATMLTELLAATASADVAGAKAAIKALQDQAAEAVKLSARVSELESAAAEREKSVMIEKLSSEGKATPGTHAFLRTLTIEQLTAYAAAAPVVVPQASKPMPEGTVELSDNERAIAAQLGVSVDKYAATKKAMLADGRIKE